MVLQTQTFNSCLPTNIRFGLDIVKNELASEIIKLANKKKVFIATDQGLVKTSAISVPFYFNCSLPLAFQHKNWFRFLASEKGDDLSDKDAVYCFLNNPRYAWRRFLLLLSAKYHNPWKL
ncbi:iron-containing alcohol dehydrogenase [Aneurinibacillus danicus]|uniref:Uncharacterized protein n=1 Tax=Aneurinibacillus danicus TaxID=267746 RepID=A0A511VB63_9BACL|nr:iron-containing alcohol dehydrogenase [Aneurinibacillus danicus]GEN36059.1 hypothetical protein ADA01nite_35190 [Aneurinibacillus danicus]